MSQGSPFFSIVVPTRNRPIELRRALASIAVQTCADFEVIIVDNGSNSDSLAAVRALRDELGDRFVLICRSPDSPGYGPSVARNFGLTVARGSYIGFLDDDDYWCDRDHLDRARRCLSEADDIDIYIANQVAMCGTETVVSRWLPHLDEVIASRPQIGPMNVYDLRRADLLWPGGMGFAQVNMYLVRTSVVRRLGGFWESVAYEEDLDFFLRLADRANRFVYCPETVSVQTVREAGTGIGLSAIEEESKQLLRMMVCQHAALSCATPEVRRYARQIHGSALKTLARRSLRDGHFSMAGECAAQATALDPSLKWAAIACALKLRSIFPSRRRDGGRT